MLNLKDSGVDVAVGLPASSQSVQKARGAGLRVMSVADAPQLSLDRTYRSGDDLIIEARPLTVCGSWLTAPPRNLTPPTTPRPGRR